MDNAESSGQQSGRAISVRPAEDGLLVRSALRRRPTAGKRSIQAQSFERHLPFLICAARITLEPPPTPTLPLRGNEKRTPPPPPPRGGGRNDSPALELWLALFLECGDALICILRHEHAPDRLALDG